MPLMTHDVALVEDQLRLVESPALIFAGLAQMLTIGFGITVTVTFDSIGIILKGCKSNVYAVIV
jgi:hypothetical protein